MKSRSAPTSVARIVELLVLGRLLASDEAEDLQRRWQGEAPDAEDMIAFTRWLVLEQSPPATVRHPVP